MQAITPIKPDASAKSDDAESKGFSSPLIGASLDWATMYTRRPSGSSTLFDLEAMTAKRMELLAWIEQTTNSPGMKNFIAILDEIGLRLPNERRRANARRPSHIRLGADAEETDGDASAFRPHSPRRSSSRPGGHAGEVVFAFEGDEDLLSHLLARSAFCMSEAWRKWFVRAEETLLRARLRLEMAKCKADFLPALMRNNGLPCEPLSEAQRSAPRLQEYLRYYAAMHAHGKHPGHAVTAMSSSFHSPNAMPPSAGAMTGTHNSPQVTSRSAEEFFSVPLALATRLIKTRSVLCLRGQAILHREQAQEVYLMMFRAQLNRGLHEAYLARTKLASHSDDDARETVMKMLDAFLEHFVTDPINALQEAASGSIGAADVRRLAHSHFPLCMRQMDEHIRREGHLKHHGRLTYGLFLKAIGLSLPDAMTLFATLMTQKSGGGGVEAFAKTSYGYNIRHNYGMEGRKMSYSSMSCATLMGLPPVVDRFDCHGCPFRFKDEGAFRSMLLKEQQNPLGPDFAPIRPTSSDIEDIVQDCKGQHYTRACYKYFVATHPGARRDTLFRSPHEYYTVSREMEEEHKQQQQQRQHQQGDEMTPSRRVGSDNFKRSMFTPTLKEDVIRPRMD